MTQRTETIQSLLFMNFFKKSSNCFQEPPEYNSFNLVIRLRLLCLCIYINIKRNSSLSYLLVTADHITEYNLSQSSFRDSKIEKSC